VSGFPTIKFMYHDGTKVKAVDYKSGRTAKDIITFAMEKAKSLAFKRIGQKSGGSSSGGSGTQTCVDASQYK
jgi:protein disulfide-isomerase A6